MVFRLGALRDATHTPFLITHGHHNHQSLFQPPVGSEPMHDVPILGPSGVMATLVGGPTTLVGALSTLPITLGIGPLLERATPA
jgi:hypothetical protein